MEGLKGFLDQRGATQGISNMQNIEKEIFEDEDVKAFLEQHKEELTPEAIRKGMSALLEFRMEKRCQKEQQGSESSRPRTMFRSA